MHPLTAGAERLAATGPLPVSKPTGAAMKHHEFVSGIRPRVGLRPIATLGWTQFAIVAVVIAAVLLLTGVAILPWYW